MKIGVALSGCDIGGLSAVCLLQELERRGVEAAMISACCVPAAAGLLYAYGYGGKPAAAFFQDVQTKDLDTAVDALASLVEVKGQTGRCAFAVNSADVATGEVTLFTNDFALEGRQLRTLPLQDAYDALSATVSPLEGLACYPCGGRRLCDYTVWHGCPVAALRMRGMERVLSFSFLPEIPRTPHQALIKLMTGQNAQGADLHLPICFPAGADWGKLEDVATSALESCMNTIYEKIL